MNYDELLAPAAKFMRPSGIRKFFDLAAEMPHCISLGVGEPDFKTPWTIRDAGIRSLEQGRTRYTANAGIKELRAEICRYLARRMELNYQPSEVLVTVGGSEAIDLTIRALVKPGDEVIIPEPCFVCYEPITSLTGGVPVHIATKAEDDFRLRADQLRAAITPRTKLLILPYPNNPTGGVMDAADLEAIAEVLRGTNIMVLSDEIYAELTYGLERHISIATLPGMKERTIVVNGFSKAYAMTGWRLGYLIVPRDLVRPMQALMQNFFLSTNSAVQKAGIAALTCADEDVARMHATYDERRRFLLGELKRLGFNIPVEPMGAFYMLINARHLGSSSMELAFDLLEKAHIGITPGIDFGSQTEGFLRLSYANSIDNLAEAMRRLEAYIRQR